MSVQVMLVVPWKKIIGKIKKIDDRSYEVTDGWLLEEIHTREGLSIVPLPIFPSNEKNGVYRFNSAAVIIEPIDVSDDKILEMYMRLTSNLVLPTQKDQLTLFG